MKRRPEPGLPILEHLESCIELARRQATSASPRFVARAITILIASALALSPNNISSALAADPFGDLDLIRPHRATAAPEFTVPRLDSGSVTLKELRGSVVFLNFWAISIDGDGADRVVSFVKTLGLTFPIGLDPRLEVANRYTVRALPSSFLIDRTGNIVAVALGPRAWDGTAADAVIETLLR